MFHFCVWDPGEGIIMQSINWKSGQWAKAGDVAPVAVPRSAFASYVAEYRQAMHAARQVEIMSGHLDRAALAIKQDYSIRDR